jgi:hypothetical protein
MEKASVQLSTKTWHYKLIKWTLGSKAPTPQNMHNLCPYFWLMVFSIIIQPVFAPLKAVYLLLNGLVTLMEKTIDAGTYPVAHDWFDNMSDTEAYLLWENWWYGDEALEKVKIPYNFKNLHKMSHKDLLQKWLLEKKGIEMYESMYTKVTTKEYDEWKSNIDKLVSENRKKNPVKLKAPKPTPKVTIVGRQIGDAVENFFVKVSDAFNSWKSIIKWTKRTVGAVITGLGLFGTFFIVQFAGRAVIWTVQHWDWSVFFIILAIIAACAFASLLMWTIGKLAEYLKYKDYDLWWVKVAYYSIILPLKWLFVDFLWKIVIVAILVKFFAVTIIWGGAKLLWKGFKGFLGIFGEYFGASYGDYCPGIEWKEDKE